MIFDNSPSPQGTFFSCLFCWIYWHVFNFMRASRHAGNFFKLIAIHILHDSHGPTRNKTVHQLSELPREFTKHPQNSQNRIQLLVRGLHFLYTHRRLRVLLWRFTKSNWIPFALPPQNMMTIFNSTSTNKNFFFQATPSKMLLFLIMFFFGWLFFFEDNSRNFKKLIFQ